MSVASPEALEAWLDELSALDSPESLRAYLTQHDSLVKPEIVEHLADAVRQRIRVDVEQALRFAEAALAIARVLGTSESSARALRAKATVLWFKGQCRPAVELMEQAIQLFEEVGKTEEVGRTLSSSIQPLILLGEYDQALSNAGKARAIFERLNDPLRLARLSINVANIHHRWERFRDALDSFERAYQQLVPLGDAEGIGVALHNMAVCLISLNEFHRALEIHHQARAFFLEHKMPLLASQADYNISYLYYLRGDYERAIAGLQAAREACSKNGDAYHAALCDLDQSEIYLELNLVQEAAEMAEQAAKQFASLGMGYEQGRSRVNLAIAISRRGATDRAIEQFARAKEIFAKEKHNAGEALVDLYRALLLFDTGDIPAAKQFCVSASEFFRVSGLIRKSVVCDLLLSRIAQAEHDPQRARELCEAARAQLNEFEAPVLRYHAHFLLGQLDEAAGERERSRESYEMARRELETLRSSLQGEELRIAFVKNKLDVYEKLVGLCVLRGTTGAAAEEAFQYIEQAKCRSLADSIFGRAQPLPTRAIAREQIDGLRGELNWYYHRLELEQYNQDGVSADRVRELWTQARACEDALLRAVREMPGAADETQRFGTSDPITPSQLRTTLGADSVLVEYFQSNGRILAAVVKARAIGIVPLASASHVKSKLRMLQLQLSKVQLGRSYGGNLEKTMKAATDLHLQELYQDLVAPLRPLLDREHLVLVPHGVLHYLPFHALHNGNEYLIDRFRISYAPSASIYALCRSAPDSGKQQSLVLGVHDSKAPWIRYEAEEVAAVVPEPRLLLGNDANQQALREWGPKSRYIHIATHGNFRGDNPMFSNVRLGDSHLSLYDLYSLNLPVDLLALSGCATGVNVVTAGDELMGLARGLLYAGARTLLLTLWDVHDRSTAEFMQSFYKQMDLSNGNKAAALRSAMRELRERYPHPYHWAPFILVGDAH